MQKLITINSRKFDGTIKRSWKCQQLDFANSYLTFLGKFEMKVEHPNLGTIKPGTISYEYFWDDRWFNIFKFLEPDNSFRNFYCNIIMPFTYQNYILDYIDLDIDILVWKDQKIEVLDINEFKENRILYDYPKHIIKKVFESKTELIDMISSKQFPFN